MRFEGLRMRSAVITAIENFLQSSVLSHFGKFPLNKISGDILHLTSHYSNVGYKHFQEEFSKALGVAWSESLQYSRLYSGGTVWEVSWLICELDSIFVFTAIGVGWVRDVGNGRCPLKSGYWNAWSSVWIGSRSLSLRCSGPLWFYKVWIDSSCSQNICSGLAVDGTRASLDRVAWVLDILENSWNKR